MVEFLATADYLKFVAKLRDRQAKARIAIRLNRLAFGNADDAKAVGDGVSELRIDYGPGYRVYDKRRGEELIILLCGGNKSSQADDIKKARQLAGEWT
ncbi:MAG: type II toxin-antitoxin system RelE/ParE family toxin [Hyphomicrobiales bacterium]